MTLNRDSYTAVKSAWYITTTRMEPVPGRTDRWTFKSRSGGLPIRLLSDARHDLPQEVARLQRDEGYKFVDYGSTQHGARTVVVEKTEVGAGYPQTHRVEVALVSGRERQTEMDDDLRDRLGALEKQGKAVWGERWAQTLHATTEWAWEAGLLADEPFTALKIAYLAWDRCNDVDAAILAGLNTAKVAQDAERCDVTLRTPWGYANCDQPKGHAGAHHATHPQAQPKPAN